VSVHARREGRGSRKRKVVVLAVVEVKEKRGRR